LGSYLALVRLSLLLYGKCNQWPSWKVLKTFVWTAITSTGLSSLESLLVFVCRKVLFSQEDRRPRLQTGLEHVPPLFVHNFPRTIHVVRSDFPDNWQSPSNGTNLRPKGL
jgi:hypothetical protein